MRTSDYRQRRDNNVESWQCDGSGSAIQCIVVLGVPSSLPDFRIASTVINRINDDLVAFDLKDNFIWAAVDERPPPVHAARF